MKKAKRLRRAVKTRAHIRTRDVARLTVHRTPRHIYAQLTDASGAKVIASASTVQSAARAVGRAIGERGKAAGLTHVAFDRSGFQYHGRVKALAEAAREAGLTF
jgi:large subunit ribosomal protein L18